MAGDLCHCAEGEIDWVSVNHFQDDILCMVVNHGPVFFSAGQEFVILQVQLRQALLAEFVPQRADGGQDKNDVVVGRVHAVEVPKVQISVWVEKFLSCNVKPVSSIRRILGGLSGVEFGVAAKKDPFQLPADGRPMAAAVILN